MSDLTQPTWRKAASCHANGTCVEVAKHEADVLVRDAKHPAGPVLRFNQQQWRRFAQAAKASA